MNWFLLALKNTFNFKGRARRREYGWFILGSFLVSFFLGFLEGFSEALQLDGVYTFFSVITMVISWALVIPQVSVTIRRLHDLGYSGWWQALPIAMLILLGAVVGIFFDEFSNYETLPSYITLLFSLAAILLFALIIGMALWLLFKDGQPQANQYGESPKYPPQA